MMFALPLLLAPVAVEPVAIETAADQAPVQERVTIRGQLRVEEIAGLAAAGVKGIINNRPDGEAPDQPTSAAIEAEAKRYGIAYWHIPIRSVQQATPADARAFAKAIDDTKGPVLAFCRTGTRSTALWKMSQQPD